MAEHPVLTAMIAQGRYISPILHAQILRTVGETEDIDDT